MGSGVQFVRVKTWVVCWSEDAGGLRFVRVMTSVVC